MTKNKPIQEHNQQTIQYYDSRIKSRMVPTGSNYLQHHVDEFIKLTGISTDMRILEVGCGMGRYTIPLASRGFQIDGIDLSQYLLDRLTEYNAGQFKISLQKMDVLDFTPDMESSYDAVIGFFTLHHLHNLERCFSAMRRLVKPGGIVAFLEPNAFNILYYFQITFTPSMSWKGDVGITWMRPNVIFPAMNAAGLTALSFQRFGFFPPFITNTPMGIKLEKTLERFPLWRSLLPATLFQGRRPD